MSHGARGRESAKKVSHILFEWALTTCYPSSIIFLGASNKQFKEEIKETSLLQERKKNILMEIVTIR
jgi:hypothetical protein